MAREFTVVGPARAEPDGSLTVPVAGGEVIVAEGGWSASVAAAPAGSRLAARVIDSGPGWWLAKAVRID